MPARRAPLGLRGKGQVKSLTKEPWDFEATYGGLPFPLSIPSPLTGLLVGAALGPGPGLRRPSISSPGIPVERGVATVVDEKGSCEPLEK
jgi:hypothetical protein